MTTIVMALVQNIFRLVQVILKFLITLLTGRRTASENRNGGEAASRDDSSTQGGMHEVSGSEIYSQSHVDGPTLVATQNQSVGHETLEPVPSNHGPPPTSSDTGSASKSDSDEPARADIQSAHADGAAQVSSNLPYASVSNTETHLVDDDHEKQSDSHETQASSGAAIRASIPASLSNSSSPAMPSHDTPLFCHDALNENPRPPAPQSQISIEESEQEQTGKPDVATEVISDATSLVPKVESEFPALPEVQYARTDSNYTDSNRNLRFRRLSNTLPRKSMLFRTKSARSFGPSSNALNPHIYGDSDNFTADTVPDEIDNAKFRFKKLYWKKPALLTRCSSPEDIQQL